MKFAALEGKCIAVWGAGREGRAALAALAEHLPHQAATLFCSEDEAAAFESSPARGEEVGLRAIGSRTDERPSAGHEGRNGQGGDGLPANPHDPALEPSPSRGGQGGDGFPAQINIITEAPDADTLSRFDIIIKSPGISAYKPEILTAQASGTIFTSGTALWFGENPDAKVIGVTGSKGKSSTSALIAHLARSLGIRTALAGNIGLPLLELRDQQADLWVIELSSFQTGEAGPLDVGIVTSLFPEHLDWHGTAERYLSDKLKLADVSRTLLVNAKQPDLLARTAQHPQRALFGNADDWHVDDEGWIVRGETRVADARELPMPGSHNRLNACAALAALELAGFDATAAATSLTTFQPLPHRLQPLGQRNGIAWTDDSISTTPQATLAAIASLSQRPLTLIVGGYDRGLDWSAFATAIAGIDEVRVLVQGGNAVQIVSALHAANAQNFVRCDTLEQAVAQARKITPAGGAIALSPGAPSFDQFRDYAERGRRFAELVGFAPDEVSQISGLGIA